MSKVKKESYEALSEYLTSDTETEEVALPVVQEPELENGEGLIKVFVSSSGIEHDKVGNQKFLKLNSNGEEYKMPLDIQVYIPERFYGCVQGLIEKQS